MTINALHPAALAQFWSNALPLAGEPEDSGGGTVRVPLPGARPDLLFAPADTDKAAAGRIHFDLTWIGDPVGRQAEMVRLMALGAGFVEDCKDESYTWSVMTDPEGNPFYL
ncbi:VOC family protein [Streptomyces sp. NPDC004111]|uniref:VOC family protein n=1 Tax=Streptomyces sp. NPDC004111 TaxID=3364690 RepID=UPI00369F45EC